MLALLSISVLATLATSLVVARHVQREALIHTALEANKAYAYKVASSIDQFLRSVHERLDYSSRVIGQHFDDPSLLASESLRLQAQDSELQVVFIADASGRIVQVYPTVQHDSSSTFAAVLNKAVSVKQPWVSQAFLTPEGALSVFICNPIHGTDGRFLGVVGGTVRLQNSGVMSTLMGGHHLTDTFAFVVNEDFQILYHPDTRRVGAVLSSSMAAYAALQGGKGELQTLDYRGIPMLAGYAEISGAHWAVVTQQPEETALLPLHQLMSEMLIKAAPVIVLLLSFVLAASALITRPLRQLAASAKHLPDASATTEIGALRPWYAEATAIRNALLSGVQSIDRKIGTLNHAAQSDALTGLANRRRMNAALEVFDATSLPFSALALDIDHFKRVNDTWGHDVGDVALQHIATIIQASSRAGDLACRAGGEEFCLLLPDTPLDAAAEIAERIRSTIAASPMDTVGTLTLSIGVACREGGSETAATILKCADERLYIAKKTGRNKVVAQG